MSVDANPGVSRRGLSGSHRIVRSQNRKRLASTPFGAQPLRSSPENMSKSSLAASGASATREQVINPVEWSVEPLRVDKVRSLNGWQQQFRETLSDQVTPIRLVGHISVLLVAAAILIISQVDIPNWNIPIASNVGGAANQLVAVAASEGATTSADSQTAVDEAVAVTSTADAVRSESLQRAAVPLTIIPDRGRKTVEIYLAEPGDTVLGIAGKFGLQPETLQWANPGLENNPDLLRIGDLLNILPFDGALHTVVSGDTLSSIASKYKVEMTDITGYEPNRLSDINAALTLGTELIIPGGTKPYVAKQVVAFSGPIPTGAAVGSGSFAWPISGRVTQDYWGGHRALDIGSYTGSGIQAADSGYVVAAGGGWNAGYGNYVVIDHGNGYVTLYAHLNSIYVRQGENVGKGPANRGYR